MDLAVHVEVRVQPLVANVVGVEVGQRGLLYRHCMYVYACMYVCMHVCMYVYIYIYIYTCIHTY